MGEVEGKWSCDGREIGGLLSGRFMDPERARANQGRISFNL